MPTPKATWMDTLGLASASQLVDRTSSPVVVSSDAGTAPNLGRKLYITQFVERAPVRRTKQIEVSRVRRGRKTTRKSKTKSSHKS